MTAAPTGQFEMDDFEILYNYQAPETVPVSGFATFDPNDKGGIVSLSPDRLVATIGGSGFGVARATKPFTNNSRCEITPSAFSAGIMIGFVAEDASLSGSYIGGNNASSYGLFSCGGLYHGAFLILNTPAFAPGSTVTLDRRDNGWFACINGTWIELPISASTLFAAVSDMSSYGDTATVQINCGQQPFTVTSPDVPGIPS